MLKIHSRYLSIGLGGVMMVLGACSNDSPEPENIRGEITLSPNQQQLTTCQNTFAFDLLKELKGLTPDGSKENVIISPLSASYCLGMLATGAEGATLTQITDRLGGIDATDINGFHRTILESLPELDRTTAATLANSMWIDNNVMVKESYRERFSYCYGDNLFTLHMHEASTAEKINRWCADRTDNLITDLLSEAPKGDILLVNTLHFEGKWSHKFNENATRAHTFHNADNSKSTVQMMREDLTIEYGEHEGAKLIRLPYGNGAYSMVMILPAEGTDVTGLLTESQYRPITSNGAMKTERVKVEIPKFDITDENILNSPLASLGISNIFGADADLSGIMENNCPVDGIMQKCRIIIDEGGTKAAAGTVTEVDTYLPPEYNIKIDRPFAFVIEEQSTGLILFIGLIYGF